MSNGPDFICIGAEKAGTTWLYDNIRHHPEVWLPPPPFKELHYFDDRVPHKDLLHNARFYHGNIIRRYSPLLRSPSLRTLRWVWRFNYHHNDSMHWYRSLFTQQSKVSGDITPSYSTLDERGLEYVRKVVGNKCKVFLIVRDPVSRYWSSVKMLYRYRGIDIAQEEASNIIKEISYPYMALKSDYSRMIETWGSVFGDGMFKTFFYDDLVADNKAFLSMICQYIGLKDHTWISPKLDSESNKDRDQIKIPAEIKMAVSQHYLPELEKLSKMIGGHSMTWLQNARNSVTG